MGEFDIPKQAGKPNCHVNDQGQEVLKCSCKCKGVRFEILRPSAIPETPEVIKTSASSTQWKANHCFCSDCRISLGHLLPSFISVGRDHVHWLSDRTFVTYDSSPEKGMKRMFCGACGASVAAAIDKNPWMDVHIGLIDLDGDYQDDKQKEAYAGILANWVVWEEVFSFGEDARDPKLRDDIRKGMIRDGAINGA